MDINCPSCKCPLLFKVNFDLPATFVPVVNIDQMILFASSIVSLALKIPPPTITSFICKNCGELYPIKEINNLLVMSELSGKYFKIEDCVICTVLPVEEEVIDNKIVAIVPPKIVAVSEVIRYSSGYNNRKIKTVRLSANILLKDFSL